MKNITPEKDNKKKTFLKKCLLFILVFILVDSFFTKPLKKKLEQKQKEQVEIASSISKNEEDKGIQKNKEIEKVEAKIVNIENDYIKLNINTKGLLLDDLTLKKYKLKVNDETKVKLLHNIDKDNFNYISINWLSLTENLKLPTETSVWKADKTTINEPNEKITFTYDNGENVLFKITLFLDEKYMINVEQTIENNSDDKIYLKPVWQIQRKKIKMDRNELVSFNGILGVFTDKIEEIKDKKLKNKNIEYQKFNWAGITEKYWLTAIINQESSNGKINLLKTDDVLKVQYTNQNNLIVDKNSTISTKGKIFTGAKDFDILKDYQKNSNIKLFDRSIDFGFFYFISKPMFLLLNVFNGITNNFGVAIIILTLIIKMLLYPSVKKSFLSMIKMKKIQPEMKYLQEKYKDNKVILQQELIKLYKKYELNPLSSIFPLLIQIPVFFSLYKVISISLNMRQAPFFGYIKDLSVGDPTTIFNLFGLLPFNPKITIGLLPCIMAITMYIQQKITDNMQNNHKNAESSNDSILEQQMKSMNTMMKLMPLIFLFIFAGFPSGLLLYWIFNNIITIVQQIYITKVLAKE